MIAPRRPSPRAVLALLFVVIGVAWGGFLGVRNLAGLGSGLEQVETLLLDWRYSLVGPRIPPPGVVIAAIALAFPCMTCKATEN
jgi:adenylate cyclase